MQARGTLNQPRHDPGAGPPRSPAQGRGPGAPPRLPHPPVLAWILQYTSSTCAAASERCLSIQVARPPASAGAPLRAAAVPGVKGAPASSPACSVLIAGRLPRLEVAPATAAAGVGEAGKTGRPARVRSVPALLAGRAAAAACFNAGMCWACCTASALWRAAASCRLQANRAHARGQQASRRLRHRQHIRATPGPRCPSCQAASFAAISCRQPATPHLRCSAIFSTALASRRCTRYASRLASLAARASSSWAKRRSCAARQGRQHGAGSEVEAGC